MKILFGVFDWGLGHATRDLPLIEALLKKRHTVHILSTGRALELLRRHFGPRCEYFDVPSLGNPYTRTRFHSLSVLLHGVGILRNLRRARRMTAAIIGKGRYDKVISDVRYDVYDKGENSYFINHQVRFISIPVAQLASEWWLSRRQAHFKYVIVPDFDKENLTGALSHDLKLIPKERIRYIGVLSQVRKRPMRKDIDYFISLSGNEPQRTLLEEKILAQLGGLRGRIVVTLGARGRATPRVPKNVTVHDFLPAQEQERMMNRARFIICRSGYTTVMELYELDIRHALLIPTPGQTEQEYLADLYEERGEYHHVSQYRLDLPRDIAEARRFTGFKQQWKTKESVERFMKIVMEE
jgi:hypothetical protein